MHKGQVFKVLLQETINVAPDKASFKESFAVGTKIPVIRWRNVLTNTEKETANGNHFMFEDIDAAIKKDYVQKRIKRGKFYNEYQHPTRQDPERYMMVYEELASDRILKFDYETIKGCKCLVGDCETATFGMGKNLFDQIVAGAIPSKSLRASGEIYTDEAGRSRKDLLIAAYDNVFIGADDDAWGMEGTFSMHEYERKLNFSESFKGEKGTGILGDRMYIESFKNANDKAKKIWRECSFASINGIFREVNADISLIGESLNGFKPNKVLVDASGNEIVYIAESANGKTMVKGQVQAKLKQDINSFLSL